MADNRCLVEKSRNSSELKLLRREHYRPWAGVESTMDREFQQIAASASIAIRGNPAGAAASRTNQPPEFCS
jgi:hypothetical protein